MEQSLDNLNEMLFNGILIVLPFVDRRTSSADQHFFLKFKINENIFRQITRS